MSLLAIVIAAVVVWGFIVCLICLFIHGAGRKW
jgi:hypothetical protein